MRMLFVVAIVQPWPLYPGFTIWNLDNIDEFAAKFVRDDMLVIGDYTFPISNFLKHGRHIGTFEPIECSRFVYSDIVMALARFDAPPDCGALYNIQMLPIPVDHNPFEGQMAKEKRRELLAEQGDIYLITELLQTTVSRW